MDRLQELDILIAQTCESIYRKCYEGKMSDAESDYFISNVVLNLTMGIANDARNRLNRTKKEGEEVSKYEKPNKLKNFGNW